MASRKSSSHKIRIIAGEWKGRKLSVPQVSGLRPTGDRIRETLFNWLQEDIRGMRCLDLFAGTGALGFEALSRGASFTQFIELAPLAATQIHTNIALLNAAASVSNANAFDWLSSFNGEKFHCVFLDPPFDAELWEKTMEKLNSGKLLAENALVYLEQERNVSIAAPVNWILQKSKSSGHVTYSLYQIQAKKEPDSTIRA